MAISKVSDLRRLASEASPGPWIHTIHGRIAHTKGELAYGFVTCDTDADAAFIAAASPEVVLGLLDDRDRLADILAALAALAALPPPPVP